MTIGETSSPPDGNNLLLLGCPESPPVHPNDLGHILGKYLYDDRGTSSHGRAADARDQRQARGRRYPRRRRGLPPVPAGQTVNETLIIQNLGDANLTIGALTISGVNASDFSVVQQPSTPVLPLGSTTFIVQFHPQSSGQKVALLTIPSNDSDEGQYEINLCGNYEPEIDIVEAPDGGDWDYGEVYIGYFLDQTFTIRNSGNKDLTLTGSPLISITGKDASHFYVLEQPVSPVNPQGTTTFVIRFTPTSRGLKTALVTITNNDWDENPYEITILGTGLIGENKIADETAFVVTSPLEGDKLVPGQLLAHHLDGRRGGQRGQDRVLGRQRLDLPDDRRADRKHRELLLARSEARLWAVPGARLERRRRGGRDGIAFPRVQALDRVGRDRGRRLGAFGPCFLARYQRPQARGRPILASLQTRPETSRP